MRAINWVGFLYNYRWMNRAITPNQTTYTITNDDFRLICNLSSASTWTLPQPSDSNQILRIKNEGSGLLTLVGTIFLDSIVSSLILGTGDMVSMTNDGRHWSVGD